LLQRLHQDRREEHLLWRSLDDGSSADSEVASRRTLRLRRRPLSFFTERTRSSSFKGKRDTDIPYRSDTVSAAVRNQERVQAVIDRLSISVSY
jgi:hypothetical protein